MWCCVLELVEVGDWDYLGLVGGVDCFDFSVEYVYCYCYVVGIGCDVCVVGFDYVKLVVDVIDCGIVWVWFVFVVCFVGVVEIWVLCMLE